MANLNGLKKYTKEIFDDFEINANDMPYISHPFTNSLVVMIKNQPLVLTEKDQFTTWRNYIFEEIDNAEKPMMIMRLFEKQYLIGFIYLSWTKKLITDSEMGSALADVWIRLEAPTHNPDVSLTDFINMFSHAPKEELMNEEELEIYNNLPDRVTVFRGYKDEAYRKGISYTLDYDIADWFAKRGEDGNYSGKIIKAVVKKEDCLCFFNNRDEQEIIVNTNKIIREKVLKVSDKEPIDISSLQ